ncbi:MAG TPA: hydrogenase maturation nickel metallochaperone HypA [Kiloniellaceae bacterium]|nr:hydrogenase maturation nickel metallochaperone HypA [Kiloniellaceae bacterium]HIP77995.1 hydrogenase maturation nickel metallochaperone HypA [Kiloniellaceae bacterium]
MHELGLTRNIVAIVGEHAGPRRVRRVCLAVGPLACVEREALSFCFDIVAEGTVLEGAALEFLDAEGDIFMIKNFEVEEAA